MQFLYGEDGMDGVWVEKQRFDILLMSRKDFRKAYEIDVNHAKFGFSQHITGQRYLTREVSMRACMSRGGGVSQPRPEHQKATFARK